MYKFFALLAMTIFFSCQEGPEEDALIYTINGCKYCQWAEKLLDDHGLTYRAINLADEPSKVKAQIRKSGHRTFPQIYIKNKFIGGYDELKKYFQR